MGRSQLVQLSSKYRKLNQSSKLVVKSLLCSRDHRLLTSNQTRKLCIFYTVIVFVSGSVYIPSSDTKIKSFSSHICFNFEAVVGNIFFADLVTSLNR